MVPRAEPSPCAGEEQHPHSSHTLRGPGWHPLPVLGCRGSTANTESPLSGTSTPPAHTRSPFATSWPGLRCTAPVPARTAGPPSDGRVWSSPRAAPVSWPRCHHCHRPACARAIPPRAAAGQCGHHYPVPRWKTSPIPATAASASPTLPSQATSSLPTPGLSRAAGTPAAGTASTTFIPWGRGGEQHGRGQQPQPAAATAAASLLHQPGNDPAREAPTQHGDKARGDWHRPGGPQAVS